MSIIAIILITISAFMHAFWNFISKRRAPSIAFFFVSSTSAAIILSPLLIIYRDLLVQIPNPVWGLVSATGFFQMLYFLGLAGAYKRGNISLAYPLVRAFPVLFVAVISLILGNIVNIGTLSLLGMGLVIIGCVILPLPKFQNIRLANYFNSVYLMALIAAFGTTGYTLVDDQALAQLRNTAALQISTNQITLLFIALQTASTAFALGLATIFYPPERQQWLALLQNRALLITSMVTGIVIMTTYGLVLASMAYVTNVSYVAAFRQLSIPIGAILGFILLKEPRFLPKIIGISIISIGLILVAVG